MFLRFYTWMQNHCFSHLFTENLFLFLKQGKSALSNDRKSVVTERCLYLFHSKWSQLEISENTLVQKHSMFILKTNSSSRIKFLFHFKQGEPPWTCLIIEPSFSNGSHSPHYCRFVSEQQRSLHYALVVRCLECAPIHLREAFVGTGSASAFPLMDYERLSRWHKN
jgi:hypothetical protein